MVPEGALEVKPVADRLVGDQADLVATAQAGGRGGGLVGHRGDDHVLPGGAVGRDGFRADQAVADAGEACGTEVAAADNWPPT